MIGKVVFKKLFLIFLFASTQNILSKNIKPWTVMVFIAANNDLEVFVKNNIRQMLKIGSTKNINIVVQINKTEHKIQKQTSKTFYIGKNYQQEIKSSVEKNETDSGNPYTLINFCKETIADFPAEHYALILWNHGTGAIDPLISKNLKTEELFQFDQNQDDIHNKTFDFLNSVTITNKNNKHHKGICFDDATGNFLTEKMLAFALKEICQKSLKGQKFSLIGFDACLMAMIEVASTIKEYADIMVASQEVELGTGWDYRPILEPFLSGSLSPAEFGSHIVKAYAKAYRFTNDYTLSCLDLKFLDELEKEFFSLSKIINYSFSLSFSETLKLLQTSRFKHGCTHFDEPDYIDLEHFLKNLLCNSSDIKLENATTAFTLQKTFSEQIAKMLKLTKKIVLANASGSFFQNASGISIYFPEHRIHRSYKKNGFASESTWISILQYYLS